MQSIFNPDEAERFAALLETESADVRSHAVAVSRALNDLYTTWRDRKYEAYDKKLETSAEQLLRFLEHADHYAANLRKKSSIVRQHYFRD